MDTVTLRDFDDPEHAEVTMEVVRRLELVIPHVHGTPARLVKTLVRSRITPDEYPVIFESQGPATSAYFSGLAEACFIKVKNILLMR